MNNFPTRLDSLMKSLGLTQAALAHKAQTSQASIYRYLKQNVKPQPKALLDLAHALGVSPHWLETGQGDKHLPPGKSETRPGQFTPIGHLTDFSKAPPIPPDIEQLLNDAHASPFATHSDSEIWEYIAETATNAPNEKALNQRFYISNIQSATQELQRRIHPISYRSKL
jgi:transcriptional regulator with XRE-family HTH domain